MGVDEGQRYVLADLESVSAMSVSARARTHTLAHNRCMHRVDFFGALLCDSGAKLVSLVGGALDHHQPERAFGAGERSFR